MTLVLTTARFPHAPPLTMGGPRGVFAAGVWTVTPPFVPRSVPSFTVPDMILGRPGADRFSPLFWLEALPCMGISHPDCRAGMPSVFRPKPVRQQ